MPKSLARGANSYDIPRVVIMPKGNEIGVLVDLAWVNKIASKIEKLTSFFLELIELHRRSGLVCSI